MAETKYEFDDPKAAFAEAEKRIQFALETGAKRLSLRNLNLVKLPASLLGLKKHLEFLEASRNKITKLEKWFGKMLELYHLDIADNQLTILPECLKQLTKLQHLDVGGNRLVVLPAWLGDFANLKSLFIGYCRLKELPESLKRLPLQRLFVHWNDGLGIPNEVLGPVQWEVSASNPAVSPADILDYYFRTRGGARPLNEAKLILLGRGDAGKTCLVNRLVHDRFEATDMTRGIVITQWPVTTGRDTVRLHAWDFGGQEILHATHQFFLTDRSLYLIVLDGRRSTEDEDADYWLKFVKNFGTSPPPVGKTSGETSPAIVVLNKFEAQPFQVNRSALLEKYPFIRAFVETDCKPRKNEGIAGLRREIESALAAITHVGSYFPAGWFQIKERLAEMKKPFISFADYRKLCAGLGENDAQAQERLAGFLNALGIALNYREDPQLREETVLNPRWITEGVYQIITSKSLAERQGGLQLSDLGRILPKKAYPARMHGFLIELMRKFELCFPFHDDPAEQRYLVPELLGKEEPVAKEPFLPCDCLNFRYDYRLMPEGLLPRFITRTHTMSEPTERWRTGVVLRWEGCRALVKADKQERQVLVRVLGEPEKRRRLLGVIRENFDQIHADVEEFKPTEWVALEGHPENWISYSKLETFEQYRKPEFEEPVDLQLVTVNVNDLLAKSDVRGPEQRRDVREGTTRPLKVFLSYSHKNEKWRAKLEPYLNLLEREGLIKVSFDLRIVPGQEWHAEIQELLKAADLYLFLVSVDLITSDYVLTHELPIAMERHESRLAAVVPVIVEPCTWKASFGKFQVLPTAGRPISDWKPHGHGCHDVEKGLRKTIAEVRKLLGRV